MSNTVQANNPLISSLIRKFTPGYITAIYGNASSGKTTSCLLAAIEAAKTGKVIFVDTESGFDTSRFAQLHNEKSILENIFLIRPKSFLEQHEIIMKLKKLCENDKVKLIIVDTIGNHYRNVLNEDHKQINGMMVEQMTTLLRIARDLNKTMILTNQASAKLNEKDEIKMVGGKLIEKLCGSIIELHKKDNSRFAKLIKHKSKDNTTFYNLGKKIEFEIREKGLFLV